MLRSSLLVLESRRVCWGPHSWFWRAIRCAVVCTPGTGEPQGVMGSKPATPCGSPGPGVRTTAPDHYNCRFTCPLSPHPGEDLVPEPEDEVDELEGEGGPVWDPTKMKQRLSPHPSAVHCEQCKQPTMHCTKPSHRGTLTDTTTRPHFLCLHSSTLL